FSVNDSNAPGLNRDIFDWDVPILGVCYGLQVLAHSKNPGSVEQAERREFGRSELIVDDASDLFREIPEESVVWMSHGDHIKKVPDDYTLIGHTDNARVAAVRHRDKQIFGVQFHPEVVHTIHGKQILKNFVRHICGLEANWTARSFIESTIEEIREQVGDDR